MGKSSNGPDLADCALYACEIQNQTGYSVTLLLDLDGCSVAPRWRIHALAALGGSVNPSTSRSVSATLLWPHREYATFSGALFCLLAWLDSLIAQDKFQAVVTE